MAKLVNRGTSKILTGPDWAMNMELCDIVKGDPGQAKDAVKAVKKRMRNQNPKVQLLSLTILETMVRHCGEIIHHQIAAKDVLIEMVKIAKKTKDTLVRDKILVLVDSWQEGFVGPRGRHPQYTMAYEELRRAGFIFPQRVVPNIPRALSTDLQQSSNGVVVSTVGPLESSDSSILSMADIQNIRNTMEVLAEMLREVDPCNKQTLKNEVIVELVQQCRAAERRVVTHVNSTTDEELLQQGLSLNDDLKKLLESHDAIALGKIPVQAAAQMNSIENAATVPPLINDSSQDEYEESYQLSHRRSSKKRLQNNSVSATIAQQIPSPPIAYQKTATAVADAPLIDLLSGDSYKDASHASDPSKLQLAVLTPLTADDQQEQLQSSNLGGALQLTTSLYGTTLQSDQGSSQQRMDISSQNSMYGAQVGTVSQTTYVVPWANQSGPSSGFEKHASLYGSGEHLSMPPSSPFDQSAGYMSMPSPSHLQQATVLENDQSAGYANVPLSSHFGQHSSMYGNDQSARHMSVHANANLQGTNIQSAFSQANPNSVLICGTPSVFSGEQRMSSASGQTFSANQQALIYGVGQPSRPQTLHTHGITFPISSVPPHPSSSQLYNGAHTQPVQMHLSSSFQLPVPSTLHPYATMHPQYTNGLSYNNMHENSCLPSAPWNTTQAPLSSLSLSSQSFHGISSLSALHSSAQQQQYANQQQQILQAGLAARMQHLSVQHEIDQYSLQNKLSHLSDRQAHVQLAEKRIMQANPPEVAPEEKMFKDLVDFAKTGNGGKPK